MNLKVFKLTSGEEIVAEIVSQTVDHITIMNPVTLAPTPQGFQPIPAWPCFATKTGIPIEAKHIMAMGEPKDQLADFYLETFSGIKAASPEQTKKLLIGK